MIRKLFVLCLLVLFLACPAFAATNARTATVANGINYVSGIADLSTGNTAEVDSDGSLQVQSEVISTTTFKRGDTAAVITGACTIHGIIVSGTSAGDYVLIYDALTATGDPVFDIYVGTAVDSRIALFPSGVSFATGVSTDTVDTVGDGGVSTTFIYEQ